MISKPTSLSNLALSLFGEKIRKKRHKYYDLSQKLKQAHIPMPPEMYVATAKLYSIVFAVVGALIGLLLSLLIVYLIGLPEGITNITLGPKWWWILDYKEEFAIAFTTIVMALIFYVLINFLFMVYPSSRASDRKTKIDRNLPYAVTFMYALSKGGMNLLQIFKSLANQKQVYGEISEEIATVLRDMELLGTDLRTALSNIATISPSVNFQEFIHGLITIIDSGGDVTRYLSDKAEYYFDRALVEQKGFLETLALMAESYVTAFVAGPLFLIVIQTIMLIMGSGNPVSLAAIIYIMIPIGSIMFMFVIKIMTPGVEGRAPIMKTEFDVIAGLKKIPEEYESAVKQLRKKIKSYEMRQALKNPIKPIREDPLKVFFISVPAGLVFLFFGLRLHPFTGDLNMWVTQVDDYFFMTLVVIFLPFAIFHELKQRQEKKVMKLIPDFLNKLASTNETGMTLYQSIGLLAKTDTSPLRPHVEKIWKDIDWGQTLTDAFIRFANRLKVYALSRTVTLIIEAMKSSGNVTEVLMISAKDATNAEIMRKERSTNMLIYVMIIYISFFVFIGIVYILSSSFLSVIAESSKSFSTMGNVGGLSGLATFDYEYYKRIFMHAAVLQGFSSGLVAGVMGEGSVPAGFKHSVIMLTIGYLLFTLFI